MDLNIKHETANLLENTIRVFSWPWDKKSSLEITKVPTRKKLTIHRNHKENDKYRRLVAFPTLEPIKDSYKNVCISPTNQQEKIIKISSLGWSSGSVGESACPTSIKT